jgi:hypothetical protein
MGPITGVPLGLGVAMLAAGELTQTGVSAPEAAVAPGAFFARLRGYCEPVPPRPEALTVTLRSWEPGDLNEAFRSAWA